MPASQRASFRQAALASGLLTKEELDEQLVAVRADGGSGKLSDRALAKSFVEQGKLNAWQAEQLLNGRGK